MPKQHTSTRSARTVLELRIRERRQTFEEFVEYAETFARQHGERGTISLRHLQRLVAGRRSDGTPPGPLRPATARLLEHIFDTSIEELLSTPGPERIQLPRESGTYKISADAHTPSGAPSTVHALRVAVAVVVRQSEVLLVCRREQDGCGISWQFPAGMVKPGTPTATVAIRETFEETSVHCAVVRDLGSRVHPITNVLCHYFLCEYLTGDAKNMDIVENASVAWANKRKLANFIPINQIFPPILEALDVRDVAHEPIDGHQPPRSVE